MRNPNVVRGISAGGPVLDWSNKIGTPLESVTGDASVQGSWQMQIALDFDSRKVAIVQEHLRGGSTIRMPVEAEASYTNIIPGLTITFGATVNDGDVANISYTDMYVVNA